MTVPISWAVTAVEIAVAALLAGGSLVAARRGGPALTRWAVPIAVGAAALVLYLSNSARLMEVDTQLPPYVAASLLRDGDLAVDEYVGDADPFAFQATRGVDGRIYSIYPPGSALAALPFVAVPLALGRSPSIALTSAVAKLAGAFWTAVSVALLTAALRRSAAGGWLLATVAYAFGTTAFSSASQDLWQHGPSQAALALALLLLAGGERDRRSSIAFGAALGFAVVCRTTDLLPALVLFALAAARRRGAGWIALGVAPWAALTAWVNVHVTGSPWTFAHLTHTLPGGGFGAGLPRYLPELLLSPSRGLLVYSPFLLAALAGVVIEARRARGRDAREALPLGLAGAAAAAPLLLLVGSWTEWHGGWSYGYRIVGESALLLTPAFASFVAWSRGRPRPMLAARVLVALSVAVHALEVYAPNDAWNATHLVGVEARDAWSVSDSQLATHLRVAGARLRGRPGSG